jgi:hypothetical protein
MSTEELQVLVDQELADPRFKRRTHFHRKTYDAGCRGPLCTQATSEYHLRRRPLARQNSAGARRAELAPVIRQIAVERGLLAGR